MNYLEHLLDHIECRGKRTDFKVTPKMAIYWWKVINQACFNSELIEPKVFVKKFLLNNWAWMQVMERNRKNSSVNLGFQEKYPNRVFFLSTLAHEMIHQWQQQKFASTSHGATFRQKAKQLKKLGLINII